MAKKSTQGMELPGLELDPKEQFETAKEKYGIWPVTVWPHDPTAEVDARMPGAGALKKAIGDSGASRAMLNSETARYRRKGAKVESKNTTGASLFSPAYAYWILNLYGPPEGSLVLDPFAGGGTRAIVAAASGYDYYGLEIRPEEAERVNTVLQEFGYDSQARVVTGDATNFWAREMGKKADFLITCPPYYDLEEYGGPTAIMSDGKSNFGDLSMASSYEQFLTGMRAVIRETKAALQPGALSCWVVGLHRDQHERLLPLHHDIARLHVAENFTLREEVILYNKGGMALWRVGNFEKGNENLIRTHEYLMVFRNWESDNDRFFRLKAKEVVT
ncbi:MAG: DNA methyltransferase [Dehalococcoidia bacterium]|nr:DNA methyltransferase [Dehalococcoidia bacterium]